MNAVMGAHLDPVDPFGDLNGALGPRERLFVDMGMKQRPRSQDAAIRCHDIPPVGVVFPTFVAVADRHIEGIDALAGFNYVNRQHIRLPGQDGPRQQQDKQELNKNNMPSSHG